MKAALLKDRGVLRVSGEPARGFLHNLVTSDIAGLQLGGARYAALLTPQGKIIADFLVLAAEDGSFDLDCPATLMGELAQKLNFYKLRAKVVITPVPSLAVLAVWGSEALQERDRIYRDPRLPQLGWRALIDSKNAQEVAAGLGASLVDETEYEAHRIALGVPKGGIDFAHGDAFPHDADMDRLKGVDFKKGCYVGQEVVSRVEHRGTARNRVVPVVFDGPAPQPGTAVTAGGKAVGSVGSSCGWDGLAMLRVDRVAEAQEAGVPLQADGMALRLRAGFADLIPRTSKAAG